MADAIRLVVRDVLAGVRPVRLRLPFRFGAATLTACPQLFVRVTVDVAGHGTAEGWAAEMMVPKWFDKRAARSPSDNVAHLAASIGHAADAYRGDAAAAPFDLFTRHYSALIQRGAADGLTELSAAFGQAVLDRAVIDAACRSAGVSFFDAARHNLLGLADTPLAPDLRGWDWDGWLARREPLRRIEARHTVGLLDALTGSEVGPDGLPASLRAAIARYGHRRFKVKLGGDPAADLDRLREVLAVLAAHAPPGFGFTLDGNEQYGSRAALEALLAGLRGIAPAPLYLEQPLPREASLAAPLPDASVALLMDEADGTLESFAQGRDLGWTGVSSKACKGVYKALLNRARCDAWNAALPAPRYFMSAEDLTCQAGLAVQQDLALISLFGLTHSERNGHHYADGMAACPRAEQQAFAAAHPDLYETGAGHPRLRIEAGAIAIDSLFGAGYAHGADPDPDSLQPLEASATML